MTVLFDKLAMIHKLVREGGFSRDRAVTLVQSFREALMDGTATRTDLLEAKAELKAEFAASRAESKLTQLMVAALLALALAAVLKSFLH